MKMIVRISYRYYLSINVLELSLFGLIVRLSSKKVVCFITFALCSDPLNIYPLPLLISLFLYLFIFIYRLFNIRFFLLLPFLFQCLVTKNHERIHPQVGRLLLPTLLSSPFGRLLYQITPTSSKSPPFSTRARLRLWGCTRRLRYQEHYLSLSIASRQSVDEERVFHDLSQLFQYQYYQQ